MPLPRKAAYAKSPLALFWLPRLPPLACVHSVQCLLKGFSPLGPDRAGKVSLSSFSFLFSSMRGIQPHRPDTSQTGFYSILPPSLGSRTLHCPSIPLSILCTSPTCFAASTPSHCSFGFLLGSASFLPFYKKPNHDFLSTPFLQGSLSSSSAPLLPQPIICCCSDPLNQFPETCKALRYLWLKKMSPELGTGESHESIPVMESSGIDAAAYIFHKILNIGSRSLG